MTTEPESAIDLRLVAYLDGELDEAERRALEKELAEKPALRAELDRLAEGGLDSLAGYDALLDAAPTARLGAMLDCGGSGSCRSAGRGSRAGPNARRTRRRGPAARRRPRRLRAIRTREPRRR